MSGLHPAGLLALRLLDEPLEGPSLAEGTPVLLLPTGTLNGERVNDPFCLGHFPDKVALSVVEVVFGHGSGVGGTRHDLKRVPLAEAIVRELTGQAKEQAA